MPHESSEDSSNQPDGPMGSHRCPPWVKSLNDDTKILTETDTETFFRDQIFSKPKPRLFSETKFSETETETLKDLAKVSKPRSFETEMSISGDNKYEWYPICVVITKYDNQYA